MTGIIWGSTFKRGVQQLEKIEESYKAILVPCEKKIIGKDIYELRFGNGDYWRVLTASSTCRGFKANISYIDRDIKLEIVDTVIYPTTIAPPYNAIHYF